MNYITMGVGAAPIIYAAIVLVMRLMGKNEKFHKLGPMKEKFGDQRGSMVHYFSYVFLPFSIGLMLVLMGLSGYSLTQIFLFR